MKNTFNFIIITEFRIKHDMSKTQFCKFCNISVREYEKMKAGDNSFKFQSLCNIATAINTELLEFFLPIYPKEQMYY